MESQPGNAQQENGSGSDPAAFFQQQQARVDGPDEKQVLAAAVLKDEQQVLEPGRHGMR